MLSTERNGVDQLHALLALRELVIHPSQPDYWYALALGTHLLRAYDLWLEEVQVQLAADHSELLPVFDTLVSGDETSDVLQEMWFFIQALSENNPQYDVLGLGRYNPQFQSSTQEIMANSKYGFKAHLSMPQFTWSEEQLRIAHTCWLRSVLQSEQWSKSEAAVGAPFVLELPGPVEGMPEVMNLGGIVFELRFNRYYIPLGLLSGSSFSQALWDYLAPNYEQIVDLAFKSQVFGKLLECFDNKYEDRFMLLDVGCGTGLLAKYAPPDWELHGIDVSEEMLQLACERRKDGVDLAYRGLCQSEATKLAVRANSMDGAILSFVEIWLGQSNFLKTMKEMHRVVRPGGKVVVNLHKPNEGMLATIAKYVQVECGYAEVNLRQSVVVDGQGNDQSIFILVAEV